MYTYFNSLPAAIMQDQGMFLELQFLKCDLMVKKLGEDSEKYTKSAVEVKPPFFLFFMLLVYYFIQILVNS